MKWDFYQGFSNTVKERPYRFLGRKWRTVETTFCMLQRLLAFSKNHSMRIRNHKTWTTLSQNIFKGQCTTHCSKSQIFVQKFNFDKTPTFSRVFHPIFLTIFLVKSKLSTAKKSKTTTFSRVFHPPKNGQFSREIKVEFLDKKWKFLTVGWRWSMQTWKRMRMSRLRQWSNYFGRKK